MLSSRLPKFLNVHMSRALVVPLSLLLGSVACSDPDEGVGGLDESSTGESGTSDGDDEDTVGMPEDDGSLPTDDGDEPDSESQTTEAPPTMDDDAVDEDEDGEMEDGETEESGTETGDMETPDCVDPATDCDAPTEPCTVAYCDDNNECAERVVESGIESEWSEWGNCEYDDECVTTGERTRSRELCENGEVQVVEQTDTETCERDTKDKVVRGEYGDCKAEADAKDECVQKEYRTNIVCVEGEETEEEENQTCEDPDAVNACGVCGNGVIEDSQDEVCEPTGEAYDGYCNDECTRVIYVDDDAPDGGAKDGSTWADAHHDLQAAIDQAKDDFADVDVEIWVASGTYVRPQTANERSGFVIETNVPIYGGFSPGQSKRDERDPDPTTNGTILSGDIAGDDGDGSDAKKLEENSRNVVTMVNSNEKNRLDGFTITGGHALPFGGPLGAGGGLLINSGSSGKIPLANLLITKNQANGGGGIACMSGNVSVEGGVVVSENRAVEYDSGDPSLGKFEGTGAGVQVAECSLEFAGKNNTISKNISEHNGGGVALLLGSGEIKVLGELEVTENQAEKENGGGIWNAGTVSTSGAEGKMAISKNTAKQDGGGFYNWHDVRDGATPARFFARDGGNVTLDENEAGANGGGFFNGKKNVVGEGPEDKKGNIHGEDNKANVDDNGSKGGGFYNNEGTLNGDFSDVKGTPENESVDPAP